MIITVDDPIASQVSVYDKEGNILGYVQSVDTDTMTGIQIDLDLYGKPYFINGNLAIKTIDIYRIELPGFSIEKEDKEEDHTGMVYNVYTNRWVFL